MSGTLVTRQHMASTPLSNSAFTDFSKLDFLLPTHVETLIKVVETVLEFTPDDEEVEEEEEEDDLEYFNIFPTREELEYHEWLLKNPPSVTDHYLGEMVLGNPFVKESKLIHDKDEGTVMFEKNNDKGDEEKGEGYVSMKRMTYYSECLNLRPEYKRDEGVILDKESPKVLWIFTWMILG
ncbi:hypothetical protein Tco_0128810 [Tanacetum coccineum]